MLCYHPQMDITPARRRSRGTAKVAEPVEAEQPHAGHRVASRPGSTGQRLIASVSI